MFSHLELNEDELDDVVIGVDDAREYQQAARWLAIGKVHTSRSFSAEALFEKMKAVWNLSHDPIFREAGENLFIFQMHCLGDWKKVVHQGPWTFRGWGVLIEDYDGLSDSEDFVFGGLHVWSQIHGIHELYRKQEVVDDLARRVGKVKEVQMSPKLFYEGNYVRIRVKLDITRPLMRFVSLTLPEGRRRLAVKYEKSRSSANVVAFLGMIMRNVEMASGLRHSCSMVRGCLQFGGLISQLWHPVSLSLVLRCVEVSLAGELPIVLDLRKDLLGMQNLMTKRRC
ncbi:hypothetical protein ACQ4PT_025431 [Festuca glaucescens]